MFYETLSNSLIYQSQYYNPVPDILYVTLASSDGQPFQAHKVMLDFKLNTLPF